MTLGIAAGHVQGSARLYKLQRIVFELTTTTRSSKHTLRIEAVLLPFNRAAIMLAVKMPKPAMQLFAVGVLALLSVAAAQALVPGPAPPMMRQPGGRRPVTIVVSEGTPKAVISTPTAAVGGTAVYTTDLFNPNDKTPVGNMVWTGTYVATNKVHYLVQTEITAGMYQGTVVASGIDAGGAPPKSIIVLGGTGAFEGATGTVVWGLTKSTSGANLYSFQLSLTPEPSSRSALG